MLRIAAAQVIGIRQEQDGWQLLEVTQEESGENGLAICYWQEAGVCRRGDRVLVNTTAVTLELGTGGYHFVVGKLSEPSSGDYYPTAWGHIMKMRYTPAQLAVNAVEEKASPCHELFLDETRSLEGTPVVIAELHSLLPVMVLAARERKPDWKIVYVMPDGAALPIAVSHQVRTLRQADLLHATVTTGQAWGGDLETVNIHTGLLAAKWVAGADLIVCVLGPGVAGTGTALGFSGMQLAEVIHAATLLGGLPIFTPRLSFADRRARHQGMSHHSRTLLKRFVLCPALLPLPRFDDERDDLLEQQEKEDQLAKKHHRLLLPAPSLSSLQALQDGYDLPFQTMGRGLPEDPSPFQAASLSVQVATAAQKVMAELNASLPDRSDEATLTRLCSYLTSGEG